MPVRSKFFARSALIMLAMVIKRLGESTTLGGLQTALMLWFGFVMTSMTVNHAFQGAKRSLTLIDGGHWLGVLLIQGAILGWWGLQ